MTNDSQRLIVGTAGHIDHGKTSMIRTITGVDLDRLPEERERGITIALGFTEHALTSGKPVSFVDVPGHERLVRTMISGAGGLDAVLLCVSAVDGVMPQTKEHLAILNLLGLHQGAVILTMADLVDEEMLELAVEDVTDLIEGTFLEAGGVHPFSSMTGQGKDEVLTLLASFDTPSSDGEGLFRLPVDQTHVRDGFGTIVRGTSRGGRLDDKSTVHLLPGPLTARVRGIEQHGQSVAFAVGQQRTAVNVAGIEAKDCPRGTVISDHPIPATQMIDVWYQHLAHAPMIKDGTPVRLLTGTTEVLGKIHIACDDELLQPGESYAAQIRLDTPLVCLPGDRYILRRTSPVETLGGGPIVDPWAPRMRQRDRERVNREIRALQAGDTEVFLTRAKHNGLDANDWRLRGCAPHGVNIEGRWYPPALLKAFQVHLLADLEAYHQDNPISRGAARRELRRGPLAHLSDKLFDALIAALEEAGSLVVDEAVVRVPGFTVALTPEQTRQRDTIAATLKAAGLEGVTMAALAKAHRSAPLAALLHLLEHAQKAHNIGGIGWLDDAHLRSLRQQLQTWFKAHDELSPGDFKTLTGLTRKTAIPWLEWLDKQRWTQRNGNARTQGSVLDDA